MHDLFEDWDNDERMRTLFAEFRPKNVNPEGWMNKMNTWTSVITGWCRKKRKVIFTVRDLKDACERKGEFPYCLEEVLMHMSREGTLTLKENLQSTDNQGWIGWGVDLLVKQPVSWGWKMLSNYVQGKPETATSQKYVHPALLKEISSSVFQKLESEVEFDNPTLSLSQCQCLCRELCDNESFSLVLSQLQSQNKLTIFTETDTQYVKLHGKAKDKTTVNETDVGYVRLQKTLQKVEGEIEKVRSDIQACTDQAKAAMKAGNKSKVQLLIRRRKNFEKIMEQKMKTTEQLEGMMHKLQATSSNQEVIGALKAGLNAQKKITSKGFNIDSIEDTMADIQDVYEEHAEIQRAVASPSYLNMEDDDDVALEQELDELLEEERRNKTPVKPSKKDLSSESFILPSVPTTNPTPPKLPVKPSLLGL